MGVTFTPSVGLAKPDEAELAENWVNGPNYNDDNNQIIIANSNIALTFYAPSVKGSTTDPNLGAGNALGEYTNFNGFVFGRFRILFQDAGILAGIGSYGISLPLVADPVYHTVGGSLTAATGTNSCIGEAYLHDNSTPANCGLAGLDVVTISGVSYVRLVTETIAGKTTAVVNNNTPFTSANLDAYSGFFFYKKQ